MGTNDRTAGRSSGRKAMNAAFFDASQRADTCRGIGPFHVVAGLHIGSMSAALPASANIHSVLTVALTSGAVPDTIRHRHEPLSYQEMDPTRLNLAVAWVLGQLTADRTVLVRSEGGRQRPALVVAMAILEMGGRYYDALSCLRAARPDTLTDFRYLKMLADADEQLNRRAP